MYIMLEVHGIIIMKRIVSHPSMLWNNKECDNEYYEILSSIGHAMVLGSYSWVAL